jgi:hypothetical protein
LSLEEIQCQMGEARTYRRNNAKQASVSGDFMICPLLCLLSKEMQRQMGVDKTNQINNAKQPSVSGEEMPCQMGEAGTNQRNNAKQPSVSGGEEVLGVYVIQSQGDALVGHLLRLLSKEMQHQMGEARTIQRNNAKQPSVSGEMQCQIGKARTIQRNDAKQPSVSGEMQHQM